MAHTKINPVKKLVGTFLVAALFAYTFAGKVNAAAQSSNSQQRAMQALLVHFCELIQENVPSGSGLLSEQVRKRITAQFINKLLSDAGPSVSSAQALQRALCTRVLSPVQFPKAN